MRTALQQLLSDFLSAIVFLAVYRPERQRHAGHQPGRRRGPRAGRRHEAHGPRHRRHAVAGAGPRRRARAPPRSSPRTAASSWPSPPSSIGRSRRHAAARLDDALPAADRARQPSRARDGGRRLRLGGADVRARRPQPCRRADHELPGLGVVHHLRRGGRQGRGIPRAVLDLPVHHPPQAACRTPAGTGRDGRHERCQLPRSALPSNDARTSKPSSSAPAWSGWRSRARWPSPATR